MEIEQTLDIESQGLLYLTQKINEEIQGNGSAYPFSFWIRHHSGEILAGCNGSVIYGSIDTDQIWVHPNHRKQALGRKLMDRVHAYGRQVKCTLATVRTMSFQGARMFYEHLGYRCDFERTGYSNESKCQFFRKDLRFQILHDIHEQEWAIAKRFRQKYFFDKVPVSDPYTWTFTDFKHAHFVFYQEIQIIGYAHLQLWPKARAAMRILVIDEPFRKQGFGEQFLGLCEQWVHEQGYRSLHMESSPAAVAFYKKHDYQEMPFEDPEGHVGYPQDIPLGKVLIQDKIL